MSHVSFGTILAVIRGGFRRIVDWPGVLYGGREAHKPPRFTVAEGDHILIEEGRIRVVPCGTPGAREVYCADNCAGMLRRVMFLGPRGNPWPECDIWVDPNGRITPFDYRYPATRPQSAA